MRSISDLFIIVFALCGALFCGLNAAGLEVFCVTQGCSLYAGYSFLGISFYVYGLAGFVLIFVLTLFRWRWNAEGLLIFVVVLAVFFDALFLAYQSIFWPCASCMIVAMLLGLVALACLGSYKSLRSKMFYGLLGIWFVLFIYVGLSVVKEVVAKPWALHGSDDAPIKVYFSPTCPACKKVSMKIVEDMRLVDLAVFYPIAKNEMDEIRIAQFIIDVDKGKNKTEALRYIFEEQNSDGPGLEIDAKLNLWKNKSHFASQGFTVIPVVISPFVIEPEPRFDPESFLKAVGEGKSPAPLWDPNDAGCDAVSSQECD